MFECCLITGLKPRTSMAEKLATMCVLPLLLGGVLASPHKHEKLADYLRKLLIGGSMEESKPTKRNEIFNAIRFLWLVYQHHFRTSYLLCIV